MDENELKEGSWSISSYPDLMTKKDKLKVNLKIGDHVFTAWIDKRLNPEDTRMELEQLMSHRVIKLNTIPDIGMKIIEARQKLELYKDQDLHGAFEVDEILLEIHRRLTKIQKCIEE